MYKHKLSEIVRQEARFSYIQDGKAYYKSVVDSTAYEFPIPVDDMGTGCFNRDEKGIYLMRWIRKALESQEMRMATIQ